jgi:hypothetical protein
MTFAIQSKIAAAMILPYNVIQSIPCEHIRGGTEDILRLNTLRRRRCIQSLIGQTRTSFQNRVVSNSDNRCTLKKERAKSSEPLTDYELPPRSPDESGRDPELRVKLWRGSFFIAPALKLRQGGVPLLRPDILSDVVNGEVAVKLVSTRRFANRGWQ